ncbi:MAG: DNA-binding transcriptional regulator LsrR (DeoR family) [Granulosicoccus sp.]|jgi:DNA-binding transcriptional regulator LsrR (DeoR family)
MASSSRQPDSSDTDMAVRAAWMHYAGGYTQAEVADKLGLSKLKAHRLITRANREGMVKVYIDGDVSECLQLERRLSEQYDLDYCEVVPDFDLDPLPLKALGIAGGQYLRRLLDGVTASSVGVGHGRTLAACVEHIPHTRSANVQFVSLLGGFSQKFAANPHDVIHRLAERTGAQAYVMPVPFLANTVKDREILMSQHGLKEVMGMARDTTLKVVGIGAVKMDSSLVATGMVDESEITSVDEAGGAGELLGHFFSDTGQSISTKLSDRTMGLSVKDLGKSKIVAIAGGLTKSRAINAVLKSRLLSGLITDERTAQALIDQ